MSRTGPSKDDLQDARFLWTLVTSKRFREMTVQDAIAELYANGWACSRRIEMHEGVQQMFRSMSHDQ